MYLLSDAANLENKKPPHDKLLAHLKQFSDAPTLSTEEIDFDPTNPGSVSIERAVRKRKGSWYQVPKDLKPKKK